MKKLTKRQKEVLDFVERRWERDGYPPTRQEIADWFGWNVNAANDHLLLIEKKGYIELVPRVARGIRILEMT